MRTRALVALLAIALDGCGGGSVAASRGAATTVASRTDELAAQRELVRAQRERIRELEAALGLAQAEARALAEELRDVRAAERTRATRIGGACSDPAEAEGIEEPAEASGPRPVLRLYGPAPAPIPGPQAPPVVAAPPLPSIRLPVTAGASADPSAGVPAIPAAPVAIAAAPAPARVRAAPADDPAVRAYREALAHLSERRLDEALAGLDAFLREHPRHEYADNALYWRGEIHYVRRDYRRALAELTALVERYPRGNKVPDALYRIGLCHARMGDRQRARSVFEELWARYPDSVAARLASREDVR